MPNPPFVPLSLDDLPPTPPAGEDQPKSTFVPIIDDDLLSLLTPADGSPTRQQSLASLGMSEADFETWRQTKLAQMAAEKDAPYEPMADHSRDTGPKRLRDGTIIPAADPTNDGGRMTGEEILDLAIAPGAGLAKAINSTVKLADEIGTGAAQFLGVDSPKVRELPQVPYTEPETVAGNLTASVSQFTVGMIGFGRVLQAGGVLQGAGTAMGFARTSVQGALSDFTVIDPLEQRLSNLVEAHPSLANPVTALLAAKPDDTAAEGRFKNAVEGLVLGSAVEGLLASVRGIRRIRAAQATGGTTAAAEEAVKVADELEAGSNPAATGKEATSPQTLPEGTPEDLTPQIAKTEPTAKALRDAEVDEVVEEIVSKKEFDAEEATGLWRHDKIDAEGGTRVVLEAAAKKVVDLVNAKTGGKQTWAETMMRSAAMADHFGQEPSEFMANLGKLSADVEQQAALVLTARRMQNGLARQIELEARKLDGGVTSDRTAINSAIQKLAEIESHLAPIRTAQARGTRQWGIIADDMMSAQTIRAIIAGGAEAVPKILRQNQLGLVGKAIASFNHFRINGMLLNFKTHIRNFAGSTFMLLSRPAEKIVGGTIEKGLAQVPGLGRWFKGKNGGATEGLAEFVGMQHSFIDSVKMTAKSFKLDAPIVTGSTPFDARTNLRTIWGANPESMAGSALKTVDKVTGVSGRLLVAHDELFQQMNYRALVYAKATREGIELGKAGKDLADYIAKRSEEAFDGAGKGMDPDALRETKVATFQEALTNPLAKGVQSLANSHPIWRIPLPFVRSPFNIQKQVLHRTPGINLLLESYRADLAAGGMRRTQAIGKMAMGGMYWSVATYLVMSDRITGRGPKSHKQREALMATGWRPYSFKTDEGYVPFNDADPASSFFGLAADMAEVLTHADEKDATELGIAATAALAKNFTDKSYVRGLSEALDALTDPDRNFRRWYRSQLAAVVPGAIRQVGSKFGASDPVLREVQSFADAIRNKLPVLSTQQPPVRDAFGDEVHYPVGAGPDAISPFYFSPRISDPVKEELARLESGLGIPAEKIAGGRINLRAFKADKGQDAYDRMLELRQTIKRGGLTIHARLEQLITSDRYKNTNDSVGGYASPRMGMLQQVFGEYQEAAERQLRKEYPDLDQAIKADEANKRLINRPNRGGGGSIEDLLKPLGSP